MKKLLLAAAAAAAGFAAAPDAARAQDFYLGEIIIGGWNFCPRGTANADGTLLPISSNSALFSLFGTIYGGDGRTTFALPDLRGRIAMHYGQGPGLPNYSQGAKGGSPTTTQTVAQMPAHSHTGTGTPAAVNGLGTTASPNGALPAGQPGSNIYATGANASMTANSTTLSINNTGGGQAMTTQSPYLAVRFCVVTQGLFPSRN